MTPTDDRDQDDVFDTWHPSGHAPRHAAQWPTHKAKARRQKAQRRALGREPRHRGWHRL